MFNHIKTDPELCIGCKTCMAACVASHTGKALFAMKPNSFDFTPRVHVCTRQKSPRPSSANSVRNRVVSTPVLLTASPSGKIPSSSMKTPVGAAASVLRLVPLTPSP